MEGLQGIDAIILIFPVTSNVLLFNLAKARAASLPAWPPPMTMASNIGSPPH
jgi:hypothetical protein